MGHGKYILHKAWRKTFIMEEEVCCQSNFLIHTGTSTQDTIIHNHTHTHMLLTAYLVERTGGVTVEAGLGVDLHVNGGS